MGDKIFLILLILLAVTILIEEIKYSLAKNVEVTILRCHGRVRHYYGANRLFFHLWLYQYDASYCIDGIKYESEFLSPEDLSKNTTKIAKYIEDSEYISLLAYEPKATRVLGILVSLAEIILCVIYYFNMG